MSYEVLLLGLLVGAANYCFRYLPLRLRVGNARPTKRGAVGRMTQQQASGWIAQQITNQGLIISANEIFWMSAGIFLVLLGLVWFAKPPFGAGGGGGGAH